MDWQPETFLDNLQGHLTWARVRLKLHTLIARARRDEETSDALEMAHLFFFMAEEAFYLDAALTVQKLFAPDEYGSLVKFLNKSLQDLRKLPYVGEGLKASDIRGHLATLEEFADQLKRLDHLRDKWFAHHDRIAFDNPASFVHEYYVQPGELEQMIDAAQSVLSRHKLAFGSDFLPGLSGETDFLAVVDLIVRYRLAYRLRFEDPWDHATITDLMFHERHSKIDHLRTKFLGDKKGYT